MVHVGHIINWIYPMFIDMCMCRFNVNKHGEYFIVWNDVNFRQPHGFEIMKMNTTMNGWNLDDGYHDFINIENYPRRNYYQTFYDDLDISIQILFPHTFFNITIPEIVDVNE